MSKFEVTAISKRPSGLIAPSLAGLGLNNCYRLQEMRPWNSASVLPLEFNLGALPGIQPQCSPWNSVWVLSLEINLGAPPGIQPGCSPLDST